MNTRQDLLMADEAFLRDFFENSPVGFHVFGPDKIIRAVNQAELDILGYRREEIIGRKKWSDLIVPEQRAQFERHWKDISTIGRVTNLRYTLQTKTGAKVDVILNASARFNRAGELLNTRGTILDVRHLKQARRSGKSGVREKTVLEQHNQALSVLLANIEVEKETLKKNIMTNLEQLILPVLRKLKRRGSQLDQRYLELLERNFLGLTSSLGMKLVNPRWKLTAREIEVCGMIKNGLATKTIADMLCVSQRTVEHHRNHIRKKLGVTRIGINLNSYLQSL
ncbi:MAG: PAS domain S-box protein [Candidatus Omnitrophica bacterium]|nr:PAS domain S-box protein [Candidatus Omnitrophota bacterium]